jgi:hypothetical protein
MRRDRGSGDGGPLSFSEGSSELHGPSTRLRRGTRRPSDRDPKAMKGGCLCRPASRSEAPHAVHSAFRIPQTDYGSLRCVELLPDRVHAHRAARR